MCFTIKKIGVKLNMKENISIIVPLYNKEKFIYNCLNSIMIQSYKFYEVLIIDDGSTDNSAQICKKICDENKKFKYYKKDNGGVSSARNLGIENAMYEYIVFIDADDYVEKDYLKSLIENKSDLVVEGFKKSENGNISEFHIFNEKCNKKKVLEYLMNKKVANIFSVPYLKLYKTSYIKKYNIRFNEKLSFGEDFDFVLQYLNTIDGQVNLIDECNYVNVIEKESLSRKDLPDVWEQLSLVYLTIKKIYCNDDTALNFYLIRFIKISLLNSYCRKFKNFRKIFKKIRKDDNFLKINLKKLNKISIDSIIYILIKMNFIHICYLIFYIKRVR